jgi:hypothetical protein
MLKVVRQGFIFPVLSLISQRGGIQRAAWGPATAAAHSAQRRVLFCHYIHTVDCFPLSPVLSFSKPCICFRMKQQKGRQQEQIVQPQQGLDFNSSMNYSNSRVDCSSRENFNMRGSQQKQCCQEPVEIEYNSSRDGSNSMDANNSRCAIATAGTPETWKH